MIRWIAGLAVGYIRRAKFDDDKVFPLKLWGTASNRHEIDFAVCAGIKPEALSRS
jgi:hypothetical protein